MSDLSDWARSVGQSIRAFRVALGLTQSQLAGDTFSKSYISQLERGSVVPSIRALSVLAERLGLTLGSLLELSGRPITLLLKKATALYFLGEHAAARAIHQKVAPYFDAADPWERCEYYLLAARLDGSAGDWERALEGCRLAEESLADTHRPARVIVPLSYWWGKGWLLAGNQRQAVSRWEIGWRKLREQSAPPGDEGLRLLHELSQLYVRLGDPQAADTVADRLKAALNQLNTPGDLSRWAAAGRPHGAWSDDDALSTDAGAHPLDEMAAVGDAESWARADATLRQAAALRKSIGAL